MSRFRWMLLIAVVITAATASPSSGADEPKPAAAFDVQETYTPSLGADPVDLVLPIDVQAKAPTLGGGDVELEVLGVDEARADEVERLLEVDPHLDEPSVTLVVGQEDDERTTFPPPGTHRLRVTVTWPEGTTAPTGLTVGPVVATFDLKVSAPTLTATPKVEVVRRTTCLLDLVCVDRLARETAEPLTVRETSGLAPGDPLTLETVDRVVPNEGEALDVTSDGGRVDAGGTAVIPYTASATKRTGTTSATVRVEGGAGIASSDISVTVTQRQNGWTFLFWTVLGLVVGWGIREVVVRRIDRRGRLTKAFAELDRITDEQEQAVDGKLRGELAAIAATLRQSIRWETGEDTPPPNDADLTTAVTDAETARGAAAADLVTRIASTAESIATADRQAVAVAALAIPVLVDPIEAFRQELAEASQLVTQGDPTGAATHLRLARSGQGAALVTAAEAWARDRLEPVRRLRGPGAAELPVEVSTSMGEGASSDLEAVQGASLEQLAERLRAAIVVEARIVAALTQVHSLAAAVVAEAPTSDLRRQLEDASLRLANALQNGDVDLGAAADAAISVGTEMARVLRDWNGRVDGAPATAAIDARNYAQALSALAGVELRAAEAVDLSLYRPLGPDAPPNVEGDDRLPADAIAGTGIDPAAAAAVEVDGRPRPSVTSAMKVVVGLIIGAGIALTALLFFPVMFEGTPVQQLGVFLWAATLPTTYEGLIGQAGKIFPAPTG